MSAFDTYRQMRDSTLRNGENARAEEQQNALLGARQQAGTALASGDYAGGANALFGAGDLTNGMAVQDQRREITAADTKTRQDALERQQKAVIAGAQGLLNYADPTQRAQAYNSRVRPYLLSVGVPEETLAQITPEHLDDNTLRSIVSQYGGEAPDTPSGYRHAEGGRLEAIPGGPASSENQRWQVTPYGLIPPAGWNPPAGGEAQAPEYVDELPPNVRPRHNSAPSARSSGGAEMSQPTAVSFKSPVEARDAISRTVPGVAFTSGTRSRADNARVGGVPTSNHVRGRAWDLVPPSGMTMGQLAQKMRSQGLRVLDEGDHVHVSW